VVGKGGGACREKRRGGETSAGLRFPTKTALRAQTALPDEMEQERGWPRRFRVGVGDVWVWLGPERVSRLGNRGGDLRQAVGLPCFLLSFAPSESTLDVDPRHCDSPRSSASSSAPRRASQNQPESSPHAPRKDRHRARFALVSSQSTASFDHKLRGNSRQIFTAERPPFHAQCQATLDHLSIHESRHRHSA
jgi:hypothetical protein